MSTNICLAKMAGSSSFCSKSSPPFTFHYPKVSNLLCIKYSSIVPFTKKLGRDRIDLYLLAILISIWVLLMMMQVQRDLPVSILSLRETVCNPIAYDNQPSSEIYPRDQNILQLHVASF